MTTILGIETSCDETAAAIVQSDKTILANVIASHIEEQKAHGGVVPEVSSRAHLQLIDEVIEKAFADAQMVPNEIDAIAVTAGPGLIGGVIVGVMTAKAMASVLKKPIIAINHLEGHALTARLTEHTPYPFLLLLISGGHCQFLIVHNLEHYELLGETLDDAMGECFDKVAKLLNLGYPGGPAVERAAKNGMIDKKMFPIPMLKHEGCNLSFSGLKTAVRQLTQKSSNIFNASVATPPVYGELSSTPSVYGGGKGGGATILSSANEMPPLTPPPPAGGIDSYAANIAASFQWTATEAVALKLVRAIDLFKAQYPDAANVVIAGGVAANEYIRKRLSEVCVEQQMKLSVPPIHLCTDNAVMIAWAGIERFEKNMFSELDFEPRARWSL